MTREVYLDIIRYKTSHVGTLRENVKVGGSRNQGNIATASETKYEKFRKNRKSFFGPGSPIDFKKMVAGRGFEPLTFSVVGIV